MKVIKDQGLKYYQFDLFQDLPVFHAVFTRHGGFSKGPYVSLNTGGTVGDDQQAVLRNHEKIYDVTGYDFRSRFDVWQVHGKRILCTEVPRPVDKPHRKADGILTNRSAVTLFMRFADCVPVLMVDPVKNVIGIIHAGWQGTQKKITQAAVEKMTAVYGSYPADILVGIGPSICQDCYQVGEEVLDAFKITFGDSASDYFIDRKGALYLDLWRANRDTLLQAGVEKIELAEICTACHLEDWFSHRAENGQTGRFAVMMALKYD